MPSKSYLPAEPDAIGMADALDHDEVLATSPGVVTGAGAMADHSHATAKSQTAPNPVNQGPMIRDQVTLRPTNAFTPTFGDAKFIKTKPPPRATPATVGGTGLPADPKLLEAAMAKMNKLGVTYEPNKEAPKHPEPKKTVISEAPPPMGAMVTNIPAFAAEVYGDAHPNRQKPEPLMNHPRNNQGPSAPVNSTAIRTTATPTLPAAQVAAPAPPPSPAIVSSSPTPPAPATQVTSTDNAASSSTTASLETPSADIPKNAKKVITTTTTTTKIVDGKEITETHVHHTVVVKKNRFGLPNLFKKKEKKETTSTSTSTTTTTEQ